jgi:guanylate kinase
MLSDEVQARLNSAKEHEFQYQPNDIVIDEISHKSLVMLVGPVATGKSFVANRIAQLDPDFMRSPVFTTREARPDDEPGMFRVQPHNDASVTMILDQIEKGQLVQYAVHPTTDRIYGTIPADYPASFNMLPVLSNVVDSMRKLPFKEVHVIGLVAPSGAWMSWLNERYPMANEERTKRLKEAEQSLEWLLQAKNIIWTLNDPDHADNTAQTIIDIVKHGKTSDTSASNDAQEILTRVKQELYNGTSLLEEAGTR